MTSAVTSARFEHAEVPFDKSARGLEQMLYRTSRGLKMALGARMRLRVEVLVSVWSLRMIFAACE